MKPKRGWRFRLAVLAWVLAFASTGAAAYRVRQFVAFDARFHLPGAPDPGEAPPTLTLTGAVHTSRARIEKVFDVDYGRSALLLPLDQRRRELLAIDWVEDATISRLWPNRLMVGIRERKPVAFVILGSAGGASRMALIDAQGAILDPPERARFSFAVLRGVSEEQTQAQRAERVRQMLRVQKDIGDAARDFSEIDASRVDSIGVAWQSGGRVVHLLLGDRNFRSRFENFLRTYPEIRRRSEQLTSFDLRLDDRITAR